MCTQCRVCSFVNVACTRARTQCITWYVTAIISSYQDPPIQVWSLPFHSEMSDLCSYRLPSNYSLFIWEIIITCILLYGKLLKLISCCFFNQPFFFFKGRIFCPPSVPTETCGSNRCADCFVHRSLAMRCTGWSHPCSKAVPIREGSASLLSNIAECPLLVLVWASLRGDLATCTLRGTWSNPGLCTCSASLSLCSLPFSSALCLLCALYETGSRRLHVIPAASETCGYKGTGSQAVVRGA